jgi:hypothetical protein
VARQKTESTKLVSQSSTNGAGIKSALTPEWFLDIFHDVFQRGGVMPRKPPALLQYKLRVKESLRRKVVKAAAENENSANQEMVKRLEASFRDDEEMRVIAAKILKTVDKWESLMVLREQQYLRVMDLVAQLKAKVPEQARNDPDFAAGLDHFLNAIQDLFKLKPDSVSSKSLELTE